MNVLKTRRRKRNSAKVDESYKSGSYKMLQCFWCKTPIKVDQWVGKVYCSMCLTTRSAEDLQKTKKLKEYKQEQKKLKK